MNLGQLEQLITKHGLNKLPAEEQRNIKNLCLEVAQIAWFAGSNHANDVADGVEEEDRHPDRKTFMKNLAKEQ